MNTKHALIALATVALTMAACQTTTAPTTHFDQADANHDKHLSLDETNNYLVNEVFSARDTNKDGKLTKDEWVVNNNPNEEKSFRARDLNHDGVVTRDEALAYGRNKGVAKKLMDAADTNRDGWLSPEELQAFHGSMM